MGGSMLDMRKTLRGLVSQRRKWDKLAQVAARTGPAELHNDLSSKYLREVQDFGSNPGALRMLTYLPSQASADSPLVVVLHGCTQTAAGYDRGAGWSTLADRYGFALLLPEQQRSNNPNGCFNWFQTGDIKRGHGEALSIRQMVGKMVADHRIDPDRVFVTGLSAGGAMASVMLATYPDVFAGGAIIAGLPYGAATNVRQAFESMFQCPARSPRAWGDLVRGASPHHGPWPRVSVWHGGADTTVIPSNAREIIKQWTDVHGLPDTATLEDAVDGYPRQVWHNTAGEELIESYTIPSMAHGAPLAVGEANDQCGAAGAFLLDVGISSSYHVAKFWGLAGRPHAASRPYAASLQEGNLAPISSGALAVTSLKTSTKEKPVRVRSSPAGVPPLDIGAVIANALKAAGLMKAT
jgi:poly(hydroxyalkanoate) depolymerase family esterase